MRQGWKQISLALAFAVAVLAVLPLAPMQSGAAQAAPRASAAKSATKAKGLKQFTGTVTALDKTTLTVEKGGKKPESRVFTKHAELKTTGDLEKDARVTVYYREEGGQSVAHRVVVKSKDGSASGTR
jgi:hypothetical protein